MAKLGDLCAKSSSNIAQKDLENCDGEYPIYGASGFIKNVNFYKQERPYIAVVKDGAGVGRVMKLPEKSSVIGTMQYIIPNNDIDVSYLAYAMEHMNLAKYCSGATIPHIYFKDYCNEALAEHSPSEQKHIAAVLDKVTDLIAKQKRQLELLNELVEARFAEMFGDPVSNSMGWESRQLGELTTKIGSGATPRGGRDSYCTDGISLIRSMNVHNSYFEYKDLSHISDEQAEKLDNVSVWENDVLLNITGASVARCCIVPLKVLPARVNQHVCIIRCNTKVLPVFVCSVLIDGNYQKYLWDIAGSGATREAITKQQVENLPIILPPLFLQKQFADFVERTDKSKSQMQKSLEQLETLKKALMQKYFG